MLGFIIPVKEKSKSRDWDKDNELLKNTLHSICNQENRSFKVFVVYTDMPYFLKNDNVVYIQYPFPFVFASDISDYDSFLKKQFSDEMGQGVFDKGKRVLFGSKYAREYGCNFVMSVDSDDLVSSQLAGFVNQHPDEKFGWFVNKGYVRTKKSLLLIRVRRNMNHLNGSTNIAHIDLVPIIDFKTKSLYEVSFFIGHGYLKERIFHEYKQTLKPLPFYAIIYLIHGNNWSEYQSILNGHFAKTLAKYVTRGKWITSSIKKEFGIS